MRTDARRVLVVAPGSLVEQWRDEATPLHVQIAASPETLTNRQVRLKPVFLLHKPPFVDERPGARPFDNQPQCGGTGTISPRHAALGVYNQEC